jgi:hypothetical protein
LLVEVVEHLKARAGFQSLVSAVFAAPTVRAALEAFFDTHRRFTPLVLEASLAVERERLRDPKIAKVFDARPFGRHPLAHHVATRPGAEGHLAPGVTVDVVADLLAALTAPGPPAS